MSVARVTGVHPVAKILEGLLAFPLATCVIWLSFPAGSGFLSLPAVNITSR